MCLDGGGGEGNKGKDREGLMNLVEMFLKGEGEGFEGIWGYLNPPNPPF